MHRSTLPARLLALAALLASVGQDPRNGLPVSAGQLEPGLSAPAGQASASSAPYYYRYYPATRNYLTTSSVDGEVWVLDPISGNQVQSVGTLASFLATAGCSS